MIVQDIYVIPVSAVALESASRMSGRVVSKHRSKLHPKTLEALMCVRSWLGDNMKGSHLEVITIFLFCMKELYYTFLIVTCIFYSNL